MEIATPLTRLKPMEFVHLNAKEGLDYQKIKPDLLSLFEARGNKLEREWDKRYARIDSARAIFTELIRIGVIVESWG